MTATHTVHNIKQKIGQPHLVPVYLLIGIAIAFRLTLSIQMPVDQSQWEDEWNYHSMAKHFVAGNGYSIDGETPTRLRTPGYPTYLGIFYWIFGVNPQIALYMQAVIGSFNVLFVYLIASRVFDTRTGLLAASITATYPALAYYDIRLLREGLTALLITATIALLIVPNDNRSNQKRPLLLGALLACASITRPETLLLAAPIAYFMLRPLRPLKKLWRPILLFSLPILLLWIPWTVRNYNYFGTISPVRHGLGSVLWFGSRWADIDGDNHKPRERAILQQLNKDKFGGLSDKQTDKSYMDNALQDIKQRPDWFVSMIGKKMVLFWRDANGVKKTLPKIHPTLPYLLNTYYYSLLLLALGAVLVLYKKREWVMPLFSIVITYMMIYAILHVRNRYRVPILPIVFVLSAGGFWALYDIVKSKFSITTSQHTHPSLGGKP